MNIQSHDKIDKIFHATFELIAKHGIHNTPMSAISRKSGVAAGTIYHYFESKEVLINALYLSLKKEMIGKIMEDYDPQSRYKNRFFRIWINYYDYFISNPNILSFTEQCSNIPIITDETKQQADAIVSPLIDFFNFGIENGILKQTNIYLIISLIHGSVVSLAKLQISGRLTVTEDVKLSVAEYSWKGLL
jgi:AcrR family transcriptional regulator